MGRAHAHKSRSVTRRLSGFFFFFRNKNNTRSRSRRSLGILGRVCLLVHTHTPYSRRNATCHGADASAKPLERFQRASLGEAVNAQPRSFVTVFNIIARTQRKPRARTNDDTLSERLGSRWNACSGRILGEFPRFWCLLRRRWSSGNGCARESNKRRSRSRKKERKNQANKETKEENTSPGS